MKWNRIFRSGVGAFGYEIYEHTENPDRFLVKVFVYDAEIKLSGDYETLSRKIAELSKIFKNLQIVFKDQTEPINQMLP